MKAGLEELVTKENIDSREATLDDNRGVAKRCLRTSDHYINPEVAIIKNPSGKMVFDQLMRSLGLSRKLAPSRVKYPYYVLTMDVLSCGMMFKEWGYYASEDELLKDGVEVTPMPGSFPGFQDILADVFGVRTETQLGD